MKTLFKLFVLATSIFTNASASEQIFFPGSFKLFKISSHSHTPWNNLTFQYYTAKNSLLPVDEINIENIEWQSLIFEYYGTNNSPVSIVTEDQEIFDIVQKLSGNLDFTSNKERLNCIIDICQKHVESLPISETQLPSIFDILFDVITLNNYSGLKNYGIFANVKILDKDMSDKIDLTHDLSGIVFNCEAEECIKTLQLQFLKDLPMELKELGQIYNRALREGFKAHRYFDFEDTITVLGSKLPTYFNNLGGYSELASLWSVLKKSFAAFPNAVKILSVSIQLFNYIYGFDFLFDKE